MATNDNYIGIAMGLDVSNLKAGLSEANKQIQLANSEFKAASSGMDDWSKSTEGLTAKVKQLDSVLDMQKKKLAGIKAEYEKVASEQGENSEAARKLKVQLNNQQSIVNTTERELKNYKETLEGAKNGTIDLTQVTLKGGKAISDLGDSASESSSKLDGIKAVAGGVGKGLAVIGGAAVAAVSGFLALAESTRETRSMLNGLETAFTTAGLSAEDSKNTYEELYGILGDEGKANEASLHIASLSHSQEDLAKWTDIAAGVYATFGDSLPIEALAEAANETSKTGKITGGLADALNWAGVSEEQFQKQLDACNTEQERQALITETLNGLYDEASDKYQELNGDIIDSRKAQAELTSAIAELGKVAEPIMTNLKLLLVDLLEAIQPFVVLIGEGLTDALNGTAGASDKLAEGLGGIFEVLIQNITDKLPMIVDVVVQLVPTIVNALINALPQLLDVVIQLVTEIINMLATLIPQIVTKIMEILPKLINSLIAAIPQLLDAAILFLMSIVDAIPTIIDNLLKALPSIITTILETLSKSIPKVLNAAIQLFMGLVKAIPQIIASLVKNLPQIITAIVEGLLSGIGDIFSVGEDLIKGLWDGILSMGDWLKEKITNFGGEIIDWFTDIFDINSPSKVMADTIGKNLGLGIGEGVEDSFSSVKTKLNKFSKKVQDNLGNIKSNLSIDNTGSGGVVTGGKGGTIINAGMNVTYNGNLSRKQLKQLENDNYNAIKMKLKMEGAI